MSYRVTYWTRGEVRAKGSSRQRIGFYTLVGVAWWVVHSKDGGQLISCHTCNLIFNFCEIIFGFPTPPAQLSLVQTVCLVSKSRRKHVKLSRYGPQNQWECVTIPKGRTCVSFYFVHCNSAAVWQKWFICNLYWNESQRSNFCVFWVK